MNTPVGGVTLSVRMPLHGPAGSFDLDVDLSVAKVVTTVGPSGAGKTTLLRLLAGLAQPACGKINVGSSVW